MRFHEILLEFDINRTTANYGARIADAFRQRETGHFKRAYSDPLTQEVEVKALMDFLLDCDPTPKKAFVLHLIRWYLDGSLKRMEDATKAIEPFTLYAKFRNRGLPPLNQMTFVGLLDLGDELKGARSQSEVSRDEEEGFYKRGEAKLLKDTAAFKIIQLASEDAAKFFGRGTRWCTAAEKDNMYDNYTEDGPLYVIAFKGQGTKKWQFHFESEQFMDERDEELPADEILSEVEVAEFFRPKFKLINVEYIIRPDDLSPYDQMRAVEEYGPNIQYFANPTHDMILRALQDARTSFTMLPKSAQSDSEYQVAAMHHFGRYFEIHDPTQEATEVFRTRLKNRIFDCTSDRDLMAMFVRHKQALFYVLQHPELASKDKFDYLQQIGMMWARKENPLSTLLR